MISPTSLSISFLLRGRLGHTLDIALFEFYCGHEATEPRRAYLIRYFKILHALRGVEAVKLREDKTGYLYLLVFLSFKIILFLSCLYKCLVAGLFRLSYSVLREDVHFASGIFFGFLYDIDRLDKRIVCEDIVSVVLEKRPYFEHLDYRFLLDLGEIIEEERNDIEHRADNGRDNENAAYADEIVMVIENIVDIRAVVSERQGDAAVESRALIYCRENGARGERYDAIFPKNVFFTCRL